MPELPELEGLRRDLAGRLAGEEVARVELASVSALKTYDPPVTALVNKRFEEIRRRGKYLCFALAGGTPGPSGDRLWLVTHLARGGWIRWRSEAPSPGRRPQRGPLALRVVIGSGPAIDITEMGTQKRLAVWVVHNIDDVAQLAGLGPDPLSDDWDQTALAGVLSASSATVKTVLTDQRLVAGIGNAYSDEILHAARLSPFRPASRLRPDEVELLHRTIVDVLSSAVERSGATAAADLKREKKEAMAVHGRTGEPCPVCGDTVRQVAFAERSLQYCPTCQTGGRVLADRRLSRLLK